MPTLTSKKYRLSLLNKLSLCLILLYTQTTFAFVVIDPSNLIQNTAAAHSAVRSLLRQAEQIHNQIKGLKYQAQNLKNLKNYSWRDLEPMLQQLARLSADGKAISFNLQQWQQQFKRVYPDFAADNDSGNLIAIKAPQLIKQQQQTTLATLQNSLAVAHHMAQSLQQEQRLITKLNQQAKSANGQLQAMQAGSAIAAETVQQLQLLRQAIFTQMNAQNAYMSQQVSNTAHQQARLSAFVGSVDKQAITANYAGFGMLPNMR